MMWDDWDRWGGHMSSWGWWSMIIATAVVVALLVVLAVAVIRASQRPAPPMRPIPPRSMAEQVLAERYARGEIGEDEYRARLAVLRSDDFVQTP